MIGVGTIGNLKCEINLNDILSKIDDKELTRKVIRIYSKFKDGLKQLKDLRNKDRSIYGHVMLLWYQEHKRMVKEYHFTEDIESHLLCSMAAKYKTAIRVYLGIEEE